MSRKLGAKTYIIVDGKLVEKPKRRPVSSGFALPDIRPFVTQDGQEITSRSSLREYERANGVRQVGNDWAGDSEHHPAPPDFEQWGNR